MERNKYIAAIVLGFLAILAIGVVSIKLFRAKRSTAPEHDAMVTITPTPSASPTAVSMRDAFVIPSVVSEAAAESANVPTEVKTFFATDAQVARAIPVSYADGRSGVRVQNDISLSLSFINQAVKKQGASGEGGLYYQIGAEETQISFPLKSVKGKAVLTLTSVGVDKTRLVGYLIYEKN